MRSLILKIVAAAVPLIPSMNAVAQRSQLWKPANLLSFQDMRPDTYVLLHEDFIGPQAQKAEQLRSEDISSSLQLSDKEHKLTFRAYLAADNPMYWSFDIIDDTTATWHTLGCDCNIGLESAVFSNNPVPYKKAIATLHLQKDGKVKVVYSDTFKKDILARSRFAHNFFKERYMVYITK